MYSYDIPTHLIHVHEGTFDNFIFLNSDFNLYTWILIVK